MIPQMSVEDRIRALAKPAATAIAGGGSLGGMLGNFGTSALVGGASAMARSSQAPMPQMQMQAPTKAQYLQDMPYGLGPRPIRDSINQTPIAPMPSALPRYEGDIMPLPNVVPAQNFQPQNPKPMPKPRAPFRMDAPPQSSPTYRR